MKANKANKILIANVTLMFKKKSIARIVYAINVKISVVTIISRMSKMMQIRNNDSVSDINPPIMYKAFFSRCGIAKHLAYL